MSVQSPRTAGKHRNRHHGDESLETKLASKELSKTLPIDADDREAADKLFDTFVEKHSNDKDGLLTLDDLKRGLVAEVGTIFTEDVLRRKWVQDLLQASFDSAKVMMSTTDEEKERVNGREFRYFLRFLAYIAQLRKIFRSVDADHDRRLSPEEFRKAAVKFLPGIPRWIDHIPVIFSLLDTNDDGQVSLAEFVSVCLSKLVAHAVHDSMAVTDVKEWIRERAKQRYGGELDGDMEDSSPFLRRIETDKLRFTTSKSGSFESTMRPQSSSKLGSPSSPLRPQSSSKLGSPSSPSRPQSAKARRPAREFRALNGEGLSAEVVSALRQRAADTCLNCRKNGRVGNTGTGCFGRYCRWQTMGPLFDGLGARKAKDEEAATPGYYIGWQRNHQASYPFTSSFGEMEPIGHEAHKRSKELQKLRRERGGASVDWMKLAQKLPTASGTEEAKARHQLFLQCDPSESKVLSLAKVEFGLEAKLGSVIRLCLPAVKRAFHAAKGVAPSSEGYEDAHDHYVEEREFWHFLVYLKFYLMTWQCFELIDTSGDHRITWQDFRTACYRLSKWQVKLVTADTSSRQYDEEVRAIWDFMDCNSSGMVLFAEFADLCLRRFLRHPRHCVFSKEERENALKVLLGRKPNLYGAFDAD